MRDWLKEKRLKKQMNMEDISAKSKISISYYWRIENDERNPSVPVAKKLADILDLDWTDFY